MLLVRYYFGLGLLLAISLGFLLGGTVEPNQSSSRSLLVGSVAIVLFVECLRALNGVSVRFSITSVLLVSFYAYFLVSILLSGGDWGLLIAYVISPTGGLLTFYVAGIAAKWCQEAFLSASAWSRADSPLLIASALAVNICLLVAALDIYSALAPLLASTIFVLAEKRDDYQKLGDYLSMAHLVTTSLTFSALFLCELKNVIGKVLSALLLVVYGVMSMFFMILAQMHESNGGFGVVGIISLLAYGWYFRRFDIDAAGVSLPQIALRLIPGVAAATFLIIIVGLLFSGALESMLGRDLSAMRILNYQQGDTFVPRSVESRLQVLSFYPDQFWHSPLLGNFFVDHLTSGEGLYAHSSLLSVQSHLGLVGTLFFMSIWLSVFRVDAPYRLSSSLDLGTRRRCAFGFVAVAVLLVYATFWTFFTWAPLWFAVAFFVTGQEAVFDRS